MPASSTYTTSTLFLRTLSRAGITHAFVNWGSDHPALLEELERQRIESPNGTTELTIVTSPNEMVALSAAQGFAQATGKIAAVIIHVDVGTQALAGAVHNVDRSRTPVFIYAGASPFSTEGEHKGARNEWIMWIQDIPDQTAIVRQYMRHTAQINSAKTVEKSVKRALQIATSDPKGPVYLWGRREAMEEDVDPINIDAVSDMVRWPAVEPTALSSAAATKIATALLEATHPVIITSHIGRSTTAVSALLSLANVLAIPIVNVCPTAVNVPFSHPSYSGVTYAFPGTHYQRLDEADVVLVLESDLPWIPGNDSPPNGARIYVVDSGDPLKLNIGYAHVDADMICRADAEVAIGQIATALQGLGVRPDSDKWDLSDNGTVQARIQMRQTRILDDHVALVAKFDEAEAELPFFLPSAESTLKSFTFTVPTLMSTLRRVIHAATPSHGAKTLILNESISNFPLVWQHLRPEFPGTVITSGGSSLGWALGAAVGASLGGRGSSATNGQPDHAYELIVVIVGDGSFMFGVPSSAYWMARRYETPFLTIVLNNGGWRSPKLSMLGVYPQGHGSSVPGAQLSVGFGPSSPDFSQIAVAASDGWAWGAKLGGRIDPAAGANSQDLQQNINSIIQEAVRVVLEEKRCAVVDCILESI